MPRITDFCSCIYVLGCRLSVVRLCDSDCGITPVDDVTIGITCAAFCFHIEHIIIIIIIIIIFVSVSWKSSELTLKLWKNYFDASTLHFSLLLYYRTKSAQLILQTYIYHNGIFLCNIYYYMFRHLYVIIRDFYISALSSSVNNV